MRSVTRLLTLLGLTLASASSIGATVPSARMAAATQLLDLCGDMQRDGRKRVLLPGGSEQRFEYDGQLMMTKLTVVNPGRATVFELENKYGKPHEITRGRRDGETATPAYDDAYRLTAVQRSTAALSEGFTGVSKRTHGGHRSSMVACSLKWT